MGNKLYNKEITLLCPTCGNDQFERENENSNIINCIGCGRISLKDELTQENQENMQPHLNSLKKEAFKDVKTSIHDMLKKSFGKNFNVK